MEESVMMFKIVDSARGVMGGISLFWLIYGIYTLTLGKIHFFKPKLKGKYARIASLFIILPFFFAAIVIYHIDDFYNLRPSSPVGDHIKDDLFVTLTIIAFLCISFFSFKAFLKLKNGKVSGD
jgi:hypothetical protein